jgi:hypothetical protein
VCRSVTLHHTPSGASFIATPCGRTAFSSQQHSDLDLFADLATPQPQLAPPPATSPTPAAAAAAADTDALPEAADVAGAAGAAGAAAAAAASGFAAGVLPLLDVCGQGQMWGLLGIDLCCGEAVICEAGGCRLHQGPGGL